MATIVTGPAVNLQSTNIADNWTARNYNHVPAFQSTYGAS